MSAAPARGRLRGLRSIPAPLSARVCGAVTVQWLRPQAARCVSRTERSSVQRGRGETRPDPTEPWEVGLLRRCFLSQEVMMMGMMRREAFVTAVTKAHCGE